MSYKMVKIGYVFPGQGAQYAGMGQDFYRSYPRAKEIFDRADSILGFPLSKICFEGPNENLKQTSVAQPAIFTTSLAQLEVLKEILPDLKPTAVCGLSLGEFTALVAANAISFNEGLNLVRARGLFMEEAGRNNPGTMASVIGLPEDQYTCVCEESGAQIANFNSREQIVFSGTKESIDKLCELAETKGAKRVIPLNVSGAFHSKLMEEAQNRLIEKLNKIKIATPQFPFIPNVTAEFESSSEKIKEYLYKQVTSSVQWTKTMELMHSQGICTLIEVGPGKVLRGLARKINPDLKVQNLDSVKDIEKLKSFLMENKESYHVAEG